MQRRALLATGACYVAGRVVIALLAGPYTSHADTRGYLGHPVDFFGNQPRPWVVALPMHAFGAHGYVTFQALLSAVSFCALALAIASTVKDRRVQVGIAGVVLLLGLSPRTTAWDTMLLSESMAMSFTALLIAALIWLRRIPWWAFPAVFTLWLLAKESHAYLGLLVLVGVTVWAWQQRRWAVPAAVVVALAWGWWTYSNDKWVEHYNVVVNVAYHAGTDAGTFRWFIAEGMPPSDAFFIQRYDDRYKALAADPEFVAWVRADGESVYAKYLLTHPRFLLEEPIMALFTHNARWGYSLVDHQEWEMQETVGVPFWPGNATLYTNVLVLLAGLGALLALREGRLDRGWLLPGLLAASTVPAAVLAHHAGPWEIERHGAILAFVLVASCWWMIAVTADVLMSGRRPRLPELGVQVVGHVGAVGAGQVRGDDHDFSDVTIEEQGRRRTLAVADTEPVPSPTVTGVSAGRPDVEVNDL